MQQSSRLVLHKKFHQCSPRMDNKSAPSKPAKHEKILRDKRFDTNVSFSLKESIGIKDETFWLPKTGYNWSK